MFNSKAKSKTNRRNAFPALTEETRNLLTNMALSIMKEIKYDNAGTVEFLYKDGKFYFMEINSRIQVEHPITEEVTGIDIVEQQLNIASGKGFLLEQDKIKAKGHAIECRINAENPFTFIPFPGTVKQFLAPMNTILEWIALCIPDMLYLLFMIHY